VTPQESEGYPQRKSYPLRVVLAPCCKDVITYPLRLCPPFNSIFTVYTRRTILSPSHFPHFVSFLLVYHRALMSSLDRRIARLVAHRNRYLRFLTYRYPILEAAKDTKYYRQYRTAQSGINYLELQRRAEPSSEDVAGLARLTRLTLLPPSSVP
jgi:hypothetical protein